MGTDVVLMKTHLRHAAALAPRMRAEDAAECLASSGLGPYEALRVSLRMSTWKRTALYRGEVMAVLGVAPHAEDAKVGAAWMLTSGLVDEHPRPFLRACRPALAEMLVHFPVLLNAIDARYEAALRWVQWLGAELSPAIPFGVAGLPFHPFVFRRS